MLPRHAAGITWAGYLGAVVYRGEVFPGEQLAILDRDTRPIRRFK